MALVSGRVPMVFAVALAAWSMGCAGETGEEAPAATGSTSSAASPPSAPWNRVEERMPRVEVEEPHAQRMPAFAEALEELPKTGDQPLVCREHCPVASETPCCPYRIHPVPATATLHGLTTLR